MKNLILITTFFCSFGFLSAQWNTTGDNVSTGSLQVGSSVNNSYSNITLQGADSPEGTDGKREFVYNFGSAGYSSILSYRGSSWDTYLQFLTMDGNRNIEPRIHIHGDGRVGIGTVSPKEKLVVNGNISIPYGNYFLMGPETNTGNRFRLAHNGTIAMVDFYDNLHFRVGSESMYTMVAFHESGNVGIGVNQPLSRLHVKGGDIRMEFNQALRFNTESFTHGGISMATYGLQLGDDNIDNLKNLWLSGYGGVKLFTENKPRFVVCRNGNIGIGTETPANKLEVNGTIRAKEVKIETGWADFVFAPDYLLPSLKEVEAHITEHRHLPGIPTESEVKEEGVNIGEIQLKLLQKIEELTLYAIEQEKKAEEQQTRIDKLENIINELIKSQNENE